MWKIALALFLLPFALALFIRFFRGFKLRKIAEGLKLEALKKLQELESITQDDYYVRYYYEEFTKVEWNSSCFFLLSEEKKRGVIAEYADLLKGIDFVIAVYSEPRATDIPA